MTVYALIPDFKVALLDNSGNPASGYKLFVYTAGTSTKATTYQDSAGASTNTNPIVLNARGELPYGLYVAHGTYKLVFTSSTDTDPPGSPIWTRDNLTPMNDVASVPAVAEWVALGATPTYISSTQFSVPGNLTGTLTTGRRLQTTNSGGTSYGRITGSSFGAGVTTVTVAAVSGTLDSGLSAVNYGLLASTNESIPDLDTEVRAVTQAVTDSSTHIATTAFVQTAKVGADRVLLADATVAAGASTVDFTGIFTNAYDKYQIELDGVTCGTNNSDLWLLVSLDAGGTWKTGGTDYRHSRVYFDSQPAAVGSTGAQNDTKIVLAATCYCTGGTAVDGIITLHNWTSATAFKGIRGDICYFGSASAYYSTVISNGSYLGAASLITGVRIMFSAGTISGRFKIYGMRAT